MLFDCWIPVGVPVCPVARVSAKVGDLVTWHRKGVKSTVSVIATRSDWTRRRIIVSETYIAKGDSGGAITNASGEWLGVIQRRREERRPCPT